MIKLEISDISFNGLKPIGSISNDLIGILNERFHKFEINTDIRVDRDNIFFNLVDRDRNKLFTSNVTNKVILKPGDPRIKSMNRDYMKTDRLTKSQEDFMWHECINGTLDALGLSACIKLYEHYDEDKNSSLIIRDGNNVKPWPFTQKVYPIGGSL